MTVPASNPDNAFRNQLARFWKTFGDFESRNGEYSLIRDVDAEVSVREKKYVVWLDAFVSPIDHIPVSREFDAILWCRFIDKRKPSTSRGILPIDVLGNPSRIQEFICVDACARGEAQYACSNKDGGQSHDYVSNDEFARTVAIAE